jgi:hypothetical protein
MTLIESDSLDRLIPWKEPDDEKTRSSPDYSAYDIHLERSGQIFLGSRRRGACGDDLRRGNDNENLEALPLVRRGQSTDAAVYRFKAWSLRGKRRNKHGRILCAIQNERAGQPLVVGSYCRANRNAYRTGDQKQPDSLEDVLPSMAAGQVP